MLGITNLDPLRFKLLFERFLNPERVSPPDFDIDFCMRRRGEVIDYVRQKYGKDCVANIITYGTLGAKMVMRDVSRVHNLAFADADRLAKMIPDELNITLEDAVKKSAELRALSSPLDEIPGVGPSRKRALLKRFGSLAALQRATPEEIARTPGIGPDLARTVHEALHAPPDRGLRVVPDRVESA